MRPTTAGNALKHPFGLHGAITSLALIVVALSNACTSAGGALPSPTTDRSVERRAPWPGIVRLTEPAAPADCSHAAQEPALSWQLSASGVAQPVRVRTTYWAETARTAAVTRLPFASPAELELKSGTVRTVVAVDGGWLVAMDRGEFDGTGLYWVSALTSSAQRVDTSLLFPVHWVAKTSFGVLALSGLCHGDACAATTTVYEVTRIDESSEWKLLPRTVFQGCAAAIAEGVGGLSILVASGCGGLHQVDEKGAQRIASWPEHLWPREVKSSVGTGGSGTDYYVSFGNVVSHHSGSAVDWFALSDCASFTQGPGAQCVCVPAKAE